MSIKKIYIYTKSYATVQELYITTELDNVDVWLKHNKLSLNVEKTNCMTFHTCQKIIELLQLSIDGKPIAHVKYFKFLGILYDENLTWKCHINIVTNKLYPT